MTTPTIPTLIAPEAIARRVRELGAEIAAAIQDDDPLFLGLLSGAEIFCADLVRAIDRPLRFEFIRVEVSSAREREATATDIHFPIPVDVREQHVVVVKDVASTGVTESWLGSQLRQMGAKSVRFAVLVDLAEERRTDFATDFHAFSLRRTGRLAGYGMKTEGRLGNLPYIGQLATG